MYYGSWKIDDTLVFAVNTHTPSTGAATDADAVPSYHIYEDETSTPLVTGTMALLNGANTVGYYSEQITLSAANGFEKGKSYNIYISATVGGVNGTTNRNFQIEAEVDANRVSSIEANVITATSIANDAITANKIATSALTAAKISSDFSEEIADAIWDEPKAGHTGATTFGDLATDLDAVLDDTGTSGVVLANDAITAAKLAADASAEIADAVWDEALAGHVAAGSFGEDNQAHALSTEISALNNLSATGTAMAVWNADATGFQIQGSFGQAVGDPGSDTDTIFALVNTIQADTDDIQLRLPGTLVSGRMDSHVGFMATGVVTAAAVATDAIGSAEFAQAAADKVWLSASRSLTTGSSGGSGATAQEVWEYASRTLTSGSSSGGGASAQEVWEYAVRTLTQGAASVVAAVTGDDIAVYRGTTWSISLTGLGALTNYDTVYFTVKDYSEQSDADAVLQVYNHLTTGLKRFNGAAPESVANGKVTIDNAALGNITITVQEAETDGAPPGEYEYDVKGIDNDGNVDLKSSGGRFTIVADLTRAITSP